LRKLARPPHMNGAPMKALAVPIQGSFVSCSAKTSLSPLSSQQVTDQITGQALSQGQVDTYIYRTRINDPRVLMFLALR